MKKYSFVLILVFFYHLIFAQNQQLQIEGLQAPVEIIIDEWGIPHIYAQNEADLFFVQGFHAAKDRLFQLEVWRRQATGTVAELLGPRELKRDIGTRLFMFRGDINKEMNHYHERGDLIITSFVAGVNAYIELTEEQPDLLPLEFQLLQTKPQKWTPEIVISRHQGLLGNIKDELKIGRLVAKVGVEKAKELAWFHPNDPLLELDPKIDTSHLFRDILELYNAYRKPLRFQPEDLATDARTEDLEYYEQLAQADEAAYQRTETEALNDIGSNNWVVTGEHTQSGYPMMANDPHRTQAAPSLRYMAHLVAPGWNVIGGGEPEIPGISIGHNEYGTWGLTVFRTDGEDLMVYKTNPKNPNQYWYKGAWKDMEIIRESIPVKGQAKPNKVELKYSIHGPVLYEDTKQHIAYAVRCAWLEVGGSPYLASLRMDQARNWDEFRAACTYSNIPGENMIWADRAGNIGWQAVGIAPLRRNWSGLVPVPGDGSYEWDGYLPIINKPHVLNPTTGIFYTANANVTSKDYAYPDALGYTWSDPYRQSRVAELLKNGRQHSLMDMAQYQTDYLSIPARELVPLLRHIQFSKTAIQQDQARLLAWDAQVLPHSIAATIYTNWERHLRADINSLMIPKSATPYAALQMKKVVDALLLPDGKFGKHPIQGRDDFLKKSFQTAIQELEQRLGTDRTKWQYGQAANKHIILKHPLSNALNKELKAKFELGPVPRGGNSFTVNNTSSNLNQSHGASFRMIVDTGDWDACLGTNSPGQSGNPDHPHYRNLFNLWAKDQFFPVFYSRKKVESVQAEFWALAPK